MKHKYTLHTRTFKDSPCFSVHTNATCKSLAGTGQEWGESLGHHRDVVQIREMQCYYLLQDRSTDNFHGTAHNNQYLFCLFWIISRDIPHTPAVRSYLENASLGTELQNLEIKMSQSRPFRNKIVSYTAPAYGFCSLVLEDPDGQSTWYSAYLSLFLNFILILLIILPCTTLIVVHTWSTQLQLVKFTASHT